MQGTSVGKQLQGHAHNAHKLSITVGTICMALVGLLLVQSWSQSRTHGREPPVIIQFDVSKLWYTKGNNFATYQQTEYPQGPNADFWPSSAQQFYKTLEGILQRYFPAEMPQAASGLNLNNKQKYSKTHLPRFMHTLYRAKVFVKPKSSIVALGEKGHVPAMLYELFKPSLLKVTTMEYPGVLVLRDTANNHSISVEQLQHNAEVEPLSFPSNSIDHIFFLEVLEHFEKDPFFAILEMHRVLKPNGTLFLSTPNLGSFSSLARLHDGWSPYAYSKYLSNQNGGGSITHVREYTWKELERFLYVAGFQVELRCFSPYQGDQEFWDFALQIPKPRYLQVLQMLPKEQQTLDRLGSTAFLIATKSNQPFERRPWQLYAYATKFKFDGYPACKNQKFAKLCADASTHSHSGSSSSRNGSSSTAQQADHA